MKANELNCKDVMVGDWVDVRNDAAPNTPHLERITPSHFLRNEHWCGVELVPEILVKNGFEKQQFGHFIYENDDENLRIEFYPKNINYTNGCYDYIDIEKGCVTITEMPIEFVHELQHVLILCETEKEIIL